MCGSCVVAKKKQHRPQASKQRRLMKVADRHAEHLATTRCGHTSGPLVKTVTICHRSEHVVRRAVDTLREERFSQDGGMGVLHG
jgi:hypothetical protein